MSTLPERPPPGKIRYKAIYRNPKANPFAGRWGPPTPTKTVDIDASVPLEEVERMAHEGRENYEFVSVEIVARGDAVSSTVTKT